MSAKAVGWVFEHSPYRGHAFVVHLAIADVVNDLHDNECWMHNATLAEKARCSGSKVREAQRAMVEDGYLERLDTSGGRGRLAGYRFVFRETQQNLAGSVDVNPTETRQDRERNPTESKPCIDNDVNVEHAREQADPACVRCHGDGRLLSSSPGPDGEPFDLPCPCTDAEYVPAPSKARRPVVGFGMPANRGRKEA